MTKRTRKLTEEHKRKIGEANRISVKKFYDNGGTSWNKGKKYSQEEKTKLTKNLGKYAKKDSIPWNKNKKGLTVAWNKGKTGMPWSGKTRPSFSEKHKKNMSKSSKKYWSDPENRKKASERLKKNPLNYWSGRNRPDVGGENHPNWKGGISKEAYGIGWTNDLKESIRIRDNYECQMCGITQKKHGSALIVHHLNGIKTDLDPKNLLSLCRSCHTKLHRSPFLISEKEIRLKSFLIDEKIQQPQHNNYIKITGKPE